MPGADGRPQAPHLDVSVFARGLLDRVVTRIYFPDEAEANAADPVLRAVPSRRAGPRWWPRPDRRRLPLRHPPAGRRTRPSSSTSERDGAGPAADPSLAAAVRRVAARTPRTGDDAWLRAMLDVEAALAMGAGGAVGPVPPTRRGRSPRRAAPERFDVDGARRRGAAAEATPVIALVARLRAARCRSRRRRRPPGRDQPGRAGHRGDAGRRRALAPTWPMPATPGRAARRAAAPPTHRETPRSGGPCCSTPCRPRTARRARPGWSASTRRGPRLARIARDRLAVQLGGAAGTLAAGVATRGPAAWASSRPNSAWPSRSPPGTPSRGRVAELAGALGVLAGELAAAAQDVVLLAARRRSGEVSEGRPPRRVVGDAAQAQPRRRRARRVACAHRVPGLVATRAGAAMPQELQRAAGALAGRVGHAGATCSA